MNLPYRIAIMASLVVKKQGNWAKAIAGEMINIETGKQLFEAGELLPAPSGGEYAPAKALFHTSAGGSEYMYEPLKCTIYMPSETVGTAKAILRAICARLSRMTPLVTQHYERTRTRAVLSFTTTYALDMDFYRTITGHTCAQCLPKPTDVAREEQTMGRQYIFGWCCEPLPECFSSEISDPRMCDLDTVVGDSIDGLGDVLQARTFICFDSADVLNFEHLARAPYILAADSRYFVKCCPVALPMVKRDVAVICTIIARATLLSPAYKLYGRSKYATKAPAVNMTTISARGPVPVSRADRCDVCAAKLCRYVFERGSLHACLYCALREYSISAVRNYLAPHERSFVNALKEIPDVTYAPGVTLHKLCRFLNGSAGTNWYAVRSDIAEVLTSRKSAELADYSVLTDGQSPVATSLAAQAAFWADMTDY